MILPPTTCAGNERPPDPPNPAPAAAVTAGTPRDEAARFLTALFDPGDLILVRLVESWNDEKGNKKTRIVHSRHLHAGVLARNGYTWGELGRLAREGNANVFFGVCPRVGSYGRYDLAFAIRTVRALWADLDHCTAAEAQERCEAAELPHPSAIVSSGNGVHLYWLLAEPYRITDAGPPLPVYRTRSEQPGERRRPFVKGPDGEPVFELPDVSPQGRMIERTLTGIAKAIGGDHTRDLVRLLRMPSSWNRKDARNGRAPVPCQLVECDPGRRYPLIDFERFTVPEVPPAPTRPPATGQRSQGSPRPCTAAGGGSLTDDEVIDRATASRNGDRFSRLWAGGLGDHGGDHSRADAALVSHLAYWCAGDRGQIDRLFRQSGLMRPKWDERRGEQTYGERTIDHALARCTHVYTPRQAPPAPSGPPIDYSSLCDPRPGERPETGPQNRQEQEGRNNQDRLRRDSLILAQYQTISPTRFPPPVPEGVCLLIRSLVRMSRRPCPIGACVFLRGREERRVHRARDVACGRYRCIVCGPRRRLVWLRHFVDVLGKHAGPLFVWHGPTAEAPAMLRRLDRVPRPRHYLQVHCTGGNTVIVATAAVTGTTEQPFAEAIEQVACALHQLNEQSRRPVSTSQGVWVRPPRERQEEWERYDRSGDTHAAEVAEHLEQADIPATLTPMNTEDGPTLAASWQYPAHFSMADMANAHSWLKAGLPLPTPNDEAELGT